MKKFEFFTEKGRNLFGERFGRAIAYETIRNVANGIEVRFERDIILSDDEVRSTNLVSKETLVNYAIFELARMHGTVCVNFRLYNAIIKVTNADNIDEIAKKVQKVREEYFNRLDIY